MPLSGKEMLKKYLDAGWKITMQKGSHVQLTKIKNNISLNETIPMHKELCKGLELKLLKRLKGR